MVGEYAVVDGASALVLAIDRGAVRDPFDLGPLVIQTDGDDRFVRPAPKGARATTTSTHGIRSPCPASPVSGSAPRA